MPKAFASLASSDAVFMHAYAMAIKDTFQLEPGEHHCIMISPVTQCGIAAGKNVPSQITSYLVYKTANALQYSDNPSYLGGSAGDYIQQLRSYINWVDLKRSTTQEIGDQAGKLFAALMVANDKYWSLVSEALRIYNQFQHLYPNLNFWKWADTSYLPLAVAQKALKIAQTEVYQAYQHLYGPNYGVFSTYMDGLIQAESSNAYAGFNQDGVADNGALIEEAIVSAREGRSPPDVMHATLRVPAYYIPDYTSTVQRWIDASQRGEERNQEITIHIESQTAPEYSDEYGGAEIYENSEGASYGAADFDPSVVADAQPTADPEDWTDLGFKSIHLRSASQNWPFLSVDPDTSDRSRDKDKDKYENGDPEGDEDKDSGEGEDEDEGDGEGEGEGKDGHHRGGGAGGAVPGPPILITDGREHLITLKLAMLGSAKFDIQPGQWDIPDIKALFPDRLPNPPNVLGPKLAKIVSIIVGYDVQLNIEFKSEKMKDEVDNIYQYAKDTGSGMHIFGVPVSPAGDRTGPKDQVTTKLQDISWNKEEGVMQITPTRGLPYPTILGVVARRFD